MYICIISSNSVSTEFAIIQFLGSEICCCFCSPRQWCVGSTGHTCRTVWHVAITQNKQKYAAVNRHQIFNQHAHNGSRGGKISTIIIAIIVHVMRKLWLCLCVRKIVREFAYLAGEQIMARYGTLPGAWCLVPCAPPLLPPTWVVQYLLKISNKLLKWKWKAPSWSGKWIGFLPFISFALYRRRVSRVRKLSTSRSLWESNFSFSFSSLSAFSFYILYFFGIKLLSTATQWNGSNAQSPWTWDSWAKVKPRQWVSAVGQKLLWSENSGMEYLIPIFGGAPKRFA